MLAHCAHTLAVVSRFLLPPEGFCALPVTSWYSVGRLLIFWNSCLLRRKAGAVKRELGMRREMCSSGPLLLVQEDAIVERDPNQPRVGMHCD
jgi:hypothetical protein